MEEFKSITVAKAGRPTKRTDPNLGKRFRLKTHPENELGYNTLLYNCTLFLSLDSFLALFPKLTNLYELNSTEKYDYQLTKLGNVINMDYCIGYLGLPPILRGYQLFSIGIAVNFNGEPDGKQAGHITINYQKTTNGITDEVCISMHVRYFNETPSWEEYLVRLTKGAVAAFTDPKNNFWWTLQPWDDFESHSLVVTRQADIAQLFRTICIHLERCMVKEEEEEEKEESSNFYGVLASEHL